MASSGRAERVRTSSPARSWRVLLSPKPTHRCGCRYSSTTLLAAQPRLTSDALARSAGLRCETTSRTSSGTVRALVVAEAASDMARRIGQDEVEVISVVGGWAGGDLVGGRGGEGVRLRRGAVRPGGAPVQAAGTPASAAFSGESARASGHPSGEPDRGVMHPCVRPSRLTIRVGTRTEVGNLCSELKADHRAAGHQPRDGMPTDGPATARAFRLWASGATGAVDVQAVDFDSATVRVVEPTAQLVEGTTSGLTPSMEQQRAAHCLPERSS